ncbi:MAG TPA: hypothetical protein VGE60_00915 [Telluria sp.]
MKPFKPYADEADVRSVGGLQIENRLDRITISGAVDLTADKAGLAHALELQRIINATVERLQSMDLPAKLPEPPVTRVPNPFE